MFTRITAGKGNALTPKQKEVLNEIASVVTKKLTSPANVPYQRSTSHQPMRASRNELNKLTTEPSWEKLIEMKFFDEEGNYAQPLLLIYPDKELCGFVVGESFDFVKLWVHYMLHYYDSQGAKTQRRLATVDVEPLTELEALALEAKNSAIIEQVDAILAKAKVETM